MYNNALLGAGDAMSDLRKAAEQALEALERCEYGVISNGRLKNSIKTLRQALAMENFSEVNQEIEEALRQALAQPKWVGLTEVDIHEAMDFEDEFDFARAIEAKLKEKNSV